MDKSLGYTYKINFDDDFVAASYKQDFKFNASTTDCVNVMLQYVNGKKPTSDTAYNAMKSALSDETLMSVDYKFNINKTVA